MTDMTGAGLASTLFIDADASEIRPFAKRRAGSCSELHERAVRLCAAMCKSIGYEMSRFGLDISQLKASGVLRAEAALCVPKTVALTALARAAGIAARIDSADAKNLFTSSRFAALVDDDLFRWRAYAALFLDGKWVEATPAFNRAVCDRHGPVKLECDGRQDSTFHEFDAKRRRHMQYVKSLGVLDDMPFERPAPQMRKTYPRVLAHLDAERARRRS